MHFPAPKRKKIHQIAINWLKPRDKIIIEAFLQNNCKTPLGGLNQMKLLLADMKKAIDEDCTLSNELERKIEKMNFYRVPKDFLFIDDYIFYCKKEYFEKASRVALLSGPGETRVPIENLNKMYPNGDLFNKFELMHVVIFQMEKSLLPTCLILYSDDTFALVSFGFTIKTTVYRKFNEIARRIDFDIKIFCQVFCVVYLSKKLIL